MACGTRMDFYEASQPHLFCSAFIKPAETTAQRATSGRQGSRFSSSRATADHAAATLETEEKKGKKKSHGNGQK